MRNLLVILILMILCCGGIACGETETNPPTDDQTTVDHNDAVAVIRNYYVDTLHTPIHDFEFDCADEPLSGTVETRLVLGDLRLLNYTIGYEHGSRFMEILLKDAGEIVMVRRWVGEWMFDPDHKIPDNDFPDEPTIDKRKEERYYFWKGEMVHAIEFSATAHSSENKTIEEKMHAAEVQLHNNPQPAQALADAKKILAEHAAGTITKDWCGPNFD